MRKDKNEKGKNSDNGNIFRKPGISSLGECAYLCTQEMLKQ